MSKGVIAMVPVRAGSTRVENKNTRPFGFTNLLQLKLKFLKTSSWHLADSCKHRL